MWCAELFPSGVDAFFDAPTGNYEQQAMAQALAGDLEDLTVSAIDGGARPSGGGPVQSFSKVRCAL